jgi:glutamate synthase domain-containing protein 3
MLLTDRGLDIERLLTAVPAREPLEGTRFVRATTELNQQIVDDAARGLTEASYPIRSVDRAVLARLSGAIATERHQTHLARVAGEDLRAPDVDMRVDFTGSAGQGFAVFLVVGIDVRLYGEANDSVCKSMSGGRVAIMPHPASPLDAERSAIIGNCALYGATGGRLFAAGQAGDRFAVRNSGAVAVIEGAGNHCCEYMTSGIVAVLGRAGRNFGAGMSNGIAYVLDETGTFGSRLNPDMVELTDLQERDVELLHRLVREHEEHTASPRARTILVQWDHFLPLFRRVAPTGAEAYVAATREAYLASERAEVEPVLARRSA